MSSYHSAFSYLGKNSYTDFGLLISHFSDNADSGETDTFLTTDGVYTDSYDGTRQNFYGSKYNSVATPTITLIKPDGGNFGVEDTRKVLRWLTGAKMPSWMDLCVGDEVKYRLLGRVKSVSQYKMDARIVGVIITFESVSPYGYSAMQEITRSINGETTLNINCDSDELYSCVYMNTSFTNTTGGVLSIKNNTIGEETKVAALVQNETIKMSDNMLITSDHPAKSFGNDFNFVFPRLAAGQNELVINGTGELTFQYITPVKLGDIAIDLNAVSEPVYDDCGNIQSNVLDWNRIVNTPKTLQGYGITDAYTKSEVDARLSGAVGVDTYTKTEIDAMFENVVVDDVYTKAEIDELLDNIVVEDVYTKTEIDAMLSDIEIDNVYTKTEIDEMLDNIDVYTKSEIDTKIASVQIDINEEELNAMLDEVLA